MNTKLETAGGRASLFKIDIFKRLLYFTLDGQFGASPVALGLDEVLDIIEMNKRGEKPADINEFVVTEAVEEEVTFLNDMGQDSITRFDRTKPRRNNRRKRGGEGRPNQGGGNNRPEGRSQQGGGGERREGNRPKGPRPQGQRPQGPRPEASGDAPKREQGGGGENNRRNRPSRRKKGGNGPKPQGQGGGDAS